MRNFLQRIMYGRYGFDSLGRVTLWGYFLFLFGFWVTHWQGMYWISMVLFVVTFFRMLSRNTWKRQQENAKFQSICHSIHTGFLFQVRKIKEWRHYRYRQCPHCQSVLRLPRKRGKHMVCCPRCRQDFEVKIRF